MVTDALRGYVSLAGGLVEVSRQQALRAARALAAPGEANQEQIGHLAEELLAASRRNRDAVLHIVAHEIERARDRLGVATANQVQELSERVEALEAEVRRLQENPRPAARSAARKTTARKTTPRSSGGARRGSPGGTR
ncbi:MAG TPA: phasin family protein [Mycobacteriales bacterium]|nr:phasin family protein [Mycobacteriales bacterium]